MAGGQAAKRKGTQAMQGIDTSKPIVVLTGAGISKESGLDTFRDADGIWSKVRIEDVATPEAFARDPDRVQAFYNARRQGLSDANVAANSAHEALATLERHWPAGVLLVTQNIDDLHERAGSRFLIHMHGELLKARCGACGDIMTCRGDLSRADRCIACDVLGQLRPHVVWFGEMPLELDRIEDALMGCGLFISIGTSGNVYPAAGFVETVRQSGIGRSIELNLEPSVGASAFDEAKYGPASEIVPAYVEDLMAQL
tara:strand:- start:14456 stop:15223 length:768 start_codon:yes stop_codon:yes gene_type:complete